MDYCKHYTLLIERASTRDKLVGYTEKHHIVPKCLGGSNDPSNIAVLTPEEHFLAHLLLVKMNPGNTGLVFAAHKMTHSNNNQLRSNKLYGWVRQRMGGPKSPEHRRAISDGLKGKPKSVDHKKKLSDAGKGKTQTLSQRQKNSLAQQNKRWITDGNLRRKINLWDDIPDGFMPCLPRQNLKDVDPQEYIRRKREVTAEMRSRKPPGWSHSDETKQKMSRRRRGVVVPSNANKEKFLWTHPDHGVHFMSCYDVAKTFFGLVAKADGLRRVVNPKYKEKSYKGWRVETDEYKR